MQKKASSLYIALLLFLEKWRINCRQKKFHFPEKFNLSCGDSSSSQLPSKSIDLIVTDPPFFDNVCYSELADFFYAWQQLVPRGFIKKGKETTRCPAKEAQDQNPVNFTKKLQAVFNECHRVLKDNGLFVFTYHHSREEGWQSIANAILKSGFFVINSHPVKSEMSVATPKSQSKNPIQLDIIIVCRKTKFKAKRPSAQSALKIAEEKISRLELSGFSLSKNDQKIIKYGQLLTVFRSERGINLVTSVVKEDRKYSIVWATVIGS